MYSQSIRAGPADDQHVPVGFAYHHEAPHGAAHADEQTERSCLVFLHIIEHILHLPPACAASAQRPTRIAADSAMCWTFFLSLADLKDENGVNVPAGTQAESS